MSRKPKLLAGAGFGLMLALSVMPALGQSQMQAQDQTPAPVQKSVQKPGSKAKAEKPEKPEYAAGGLYKCVDADGATTYTNTGTVKGCKKIETDTINTVSLPHTPTAVAKSNGKVDAGAQRTRDTDRRRILEDELAAEQKRLDDLKKQFNNGDPERQGDERNYQKYLDRTEQLKADVARSEANVDSLKRELSSIKD